MKASTSKKPAPPPPRSGRGWIAAVVALAVFAGALAIYFTRGKGPSAHRSRGAAAVVKGSYRNRAILPPPEADAPEQEQPAIRGNVYDSEGSRIAGANIVVLTYDVAGNMASAVTTVQSDDDGQFEIPLASGTYQLNVSQEGYGPTSIVAETGDTVSAVLPRSGGIKGHVVDAKGKPVKRFTIDLVSAVPGDAPAPPPVWSKTFDSRDGSFSANQFPAWPVVVRASSPDYAPGFSKPMQIRPEETRELTLTLADGCVLEGKVVDKEGQPLPSVLVNAEERLTAGTMVDPVIQAATQDVSGKDGSFRLEHVPRGTVMVRGYDGDNAASTITVEVTECDKLSPVKLVMSLGGSVEGITRSADGKPLPGAGVVVTERAVGIVKTVSDNEGHYRFDQLPPGIFRIQVDHDGQSALKFVQIRDGATTHLDLQLFGTGTGELKGKVTAGDKPLAGARLLVASNHGRAAGLAMYFPVTGKDGTFRVPSIPEGAYLISVMSTPAGTGVQIKKGETAEANIDVSPMLGVGQPGPDAQPTREHARRLPEWRKQHQQAQEGAEGQPAEGAGATPTP